MQIKNNTINGLDLFNIELKNSLIFHIPHSSVNIPLYNNFNLELINDEINKLTDWATDKIFDVKETTKIITPFSRIFCDVERFSDDSIEPMYKYGRGYFYTKTDNGSILREENEELKKFIYNNYYLPHHNLLNELVNLKIKESGYAIIVDCHSYSDIPFNTDLIKTNNRPDICIGIDEFHTPIFLKNMIVNYFQKLGYSVLINNPYSGTIVNNNSYLKHKNVYSIMIEINRKLYMNEKTYKINNNKVKKLNKIINNLFK